MAASKTYETIQSQPRELRRLLTEGWEGADEAAARLASARRVFLIGTGTSLHACQVGEHLLRLAGLDAWAVPAMDFSLYPRPLRGDDAAIVVSHRGTKLFSVRGLKQAFAEGLSVIGVTGQGSPMEGPQVILRTVPQETSSCHTASYTTAMLVLAQIAVRLGALTGRTAAANLRPDLERLPDWVERVLLREDDVRAVAHDAARRPRLMYTGAGPNSPTATEGALKAKEAAYVTAEGLQLEQLIHGPLVAVQREDLAILVSASGPAAGRLRETAAALATIGTRTWIVGEAVEGASGDRFASEGVPELLSPLLLVVPLQLLAEFLAQERGANPDTLRADDPVYKEAMAKIPL